MTLGRFAIIYILWNKKGHSDHAMSITIANNQNMENFSPAAPKSTMANTGTNPIEHPEPQTNHIEHHEPQTKPPSYDSLNPALLEKDPALFTPEERFTYGRSMIEKGRRE